MSSFIRLSMSNYETCIWGESLLLQPVRCREKKFTPILMTRTSILINVLLDPAFRIHTFCGCCIENFPPTCDSHEFRCTFEEGRASGARGSHSLSHWRAGWYLKALKSLPGRLPLDRRCAWHSGPWTSRSAALIFFFFKLPHRGHSSHYLCILKNMP